jgi:hypothetical protein
MEVIEIMKTANRQAIWIVDEDGNDIVSVERKFSKAFAR